MNTNSNVYTIIYTTVIVVVVAAVLAFVSTSLKPMQNANIKAETLSQMMTAAGLGSKEDFSKMGNDGVLGTYSENIEQAFTVNLAGERTGELKTAKDEIELIDNLKPQNKAILAAGEPQLPVYKFKSGVTVVPVYGAGLWGPIWGYIALEEDLPVLEPRSRTSLHSRPSSRVRSSISRTLPILLTSSREEHPRELWTRLTLSQAPL